MNRFDDAVIALVSGAPAAPELDTLRARIRRHRRRRGIAIVAVVGTILVASAGVAASVGHDAHGSLVSVSPAAPALTAAQEAWCVPITRDAAIARVMGFRDEVVAGDIAHAKLVSAPELPESPGVSVATTVPVNGPELVWAVEVTGSVYPAFARDTTPYSWAIYEVDARTGDLDGVRAGKNAAPAYWDTVPDHSSECPADTAVTPTSAPAPTTTVSVGFHSGPPAGPTPPPCSPHQTQPSMNGSFCGPVPGPGNGLGPAGECTGAETGPPCGAGMVPGRYYTYTLPGRCDGRLVLDGRHWISELPPPTPVPDMDVWVSVDATGTHAGFISPQGSVGFDPDHGRPPAACTG